MKKILLFVLLFLVSVSFSGCLPSVGKGFGFLGKGKESTSISTEAPADAAKYIESVQKLELEQKKAIDEATAKYDKLKAELVSAYNIRQKIDYSSFDYMSQVNYGIFYLSKDFQENRNLQLIHMKAEENMYRMTPLDPSVKTFIEQEVEREKNMEIGELKAKYEKLFQESRSVYSQWEQADKKVKDLETQKAEVQKENASLFRKIEMDKVKAMADIEASAKAAEEKAKTEQLNIIRGWMAKVFAVVGVIAILAGILMKSINFIIPGLVCGGMALAVTVIPMWTVFVFLGVAMVSMLILDPKKGKFNFTKVENKQP
jgi:hypothetical protein